MRAKFSRARTIATLLAMPLLASGLPALDLLPRHGSYSGFALPEEPTLPESERHPSLWFAEDSVVELREKRAKDDLARSYWQSVSQSAYVLAPLPERVTADDEKNAIHKYYGDTTQIAAYNGLMYLLGGEEKKSAYLDKATAAILASFEGPLYEFDPKVRSTPVDEIYQGVWIQNLAAAYDWIQPSLDRKTDELIRSKLAHHGEYMHERLFSWAATPHNHLSKPAWGLGSLALCLSDHPSAREWLRSAIRASNLNTSYFFSSDGIYREGSHYYLFSFINFLPFLYHYRNATGYDCFEPFQPAFEWPILVRNAKGWMPNQEDSYLRPYPSQLVAKAYRDTPTRLHSTAPLSSILQWNFRTTDYEAFDEAERATGFNYSGATWDYAKPLIEYLCYEPSIEATAPDSGPIVFLDSGQTAFRNSWTDSDDPQRFLLFHGVPEADNHEHFDMLSYIVEAEGQMMASDAGYSRASYGEAVRKEWYRTPEAHNVVMVDGNAPQMKYSNEPARSADRLVSPFFSAEMKTAPYDAGGIHERLVCLIDKERFVILDHVSLSEESVIASVYHGGRAEASKKEASQYLWEYSDDVYGGRAFLTQHFFGADFTTEEKQGEVTYIKGDYAFFPYLLRSKKARRALFMDVLHPSAEASQAIDYQAERLSDRFLSVVSDTDRLLASDGTAEISSGNLAAEARLAYLSRPSDDTMRLALVAGRSATVANTLAVSLDQPSTLSLEWNRDRNQLMVYLADQPPTQIAVKTEQSEHTLPLNPGPNTFTLE